MYRNRKEVFGDTPIYDGVIEKIIKNQDYISAITMYFYMQTTEEEKEKLESIIIAAKLLGYEMPM
jgi:hypothetical protein